jgi:hypothetical protein
MCSRAAAFRDNDGRDAIIVLFDFGCGYGVPMSRSGGSLRSGLFLPFVKSDDDGRIPRPTWRGTNHTDRLFDNRIKIAR